MPGLRVAQGGLWFPPIRSTLHLFLRHPMNYYNTRIVERHEHRTELMNSRAEYANFCMSLTTIMDDVAMAWYDEVKRSNICYDV